MSSSFLPLEPDTLARRPRPVPLGDADPIVFGAPAIGEEEINEVVDTLRSGWIGTGPKTKRFEHEFASFVGGDYAVATNSCTAALHLALVCLGVGPGDEVITTPLTFVATANVIEHCGATPVLVDVRTSDGNIDVGKAAAAVTSRTKAIVPVHYAGAPADVQALRERHPDIPIVVDAAHSVEMQYEDGSGSACGGATCAAYSFYATKNMTTGEGGMLVTNDRELAEEARIRSLHGLDNDAWRRYAGGPSRHRTYEAVNAGFKYNMTDLQASLGLHQLARIESAHARRCEIWDRYNEEFLDLEAVEIPPVSLQPTRDRRHARHLYTLWFDWKALGLDRAEAVEFFTDCGIGVGWHFHAVHLHRFYRERYGFGRGDFPQAEDISNRTVSIPLSASLTDEQVGRVVAAVRALAG